jgi:hypothetical protein
MNLPGNYMVQASLAAVYAMNGEQQKAQKTLARLLELRPIMRLTRASRFALAAYPTTSSNSLCVACSVRGSRSLKKNKRVRWRLHFQSSRHGKR